MTIKALNNSVVIVVPSVIREQCNLIAEIMGWGPNSFSVPLTPDGVNITHYGLRSECDDTFIGWLRGESELPTIVTRDPKIKMVLNTIILDVSPDKFNPQRGLLWGSEHFDYVCNQNNLTRYDNNILTNIQDDDISGNT